MSYHGKVIGPNGQVYMCEHNHRTMTAAVTCANSSATRRMAALEWNRAAVQAAQRAALARQRAEQRAAAQARRIAAQEAAAARRAAAQAAAEEAKAAKRAAKLAAMPPRRAWKKMTPEERLLKIARAELGFYGKVISPEAKAAYDARASKDAATRPPASAESGPPRAPAPPRAHTPTGVPAYVRALDLSLSPRERAVAKAEAAGDPEQWQKYVAALRAQKAYNEIPGHEPRSGGNGLPPRGMPTARPAAPRAPVPPESVPPVAPVPSQIRQAREDRARGTPELRPAARTLQTLSRAADAEVRPAGGVPHSGPVATGLRGDGLFVVGLDVMPGVYRTTGPAGESSGSVALMKSTSMHDLVDFTIVKGPVTITVGPGIKAVKVSGCQPWQRLGDNLDEVIAAARKASGPAGRA